MYVAVKAVYTCWALVKMGEVCCALLCVAEERSAEANQKRQRVSYDAHTERGAVGR